MTSSHFDVDGGMRGWQTVTDRLPVGGLQRLGSTPARTVGVEDSSNGLRSASAADSSSWQFRNPTYPPASDAQALPDAVVNNLTELTPEFVANLAS